jgi:hypothetical protein
VKVQDLSTQVNETLESLADEFTDESTDELAVKVNTMFQRTKNLKRMTNRNSRIKQLEVLLEVLGMLSEALEEIERMNVIPASEVASSYKKVSQFLKQAEPLLINLETENIYLP